MKIEGVVTAMISEYPFKSPGIGESRTFPSSVRIPSSVRSVLPHIKKVDTNASYFIF